MFQIVFLSLCAGVCHFDEKEHLLEITFTARIENNTNARICTFKPWKPKVVLRSAVSEILMQSVMFSLALLATVDRAGPQRLNQRVV